MTHSRKASTPNFGTISLVLCISTLSILILPSRAQELNSVSTSESGLTSSGAPGAWHSDEAVHVIGLPEIKEKEKGLLSISPTTLTFFSQQSRAAVERADISRVTVGDVSVETGGTAGKITRAIIPFGGGAAVATVTHKQLSLLTIEFRDQRNAFHGAVFLLPKDEAILAQQQLGPQTLPALVEQPDGCHGVKEAVIPDTIKLSAIATQGEPVPAEYRVLLYEQLVRRLREQGAFAAVYREGNEDPAATCPKYNLVLTIDAFKKGNAALRASTGPVGFFVGTTSLNFHVQVRDVNGKMLLDKEIHASQRGDTDSLNIGDKIAKSLTKELKKASAHPARS